MPLEPPDFLRPVGRLDPDWLGGPEAATSTLTALIDAASDVASDAEARRCWVYWRAFERVADDAMRDPATQRDRDKSDSYSESQLAHWQRLAASYERCYRRAVGEAGSFPRGTRLRDARSRW